MQKTIGIRPELELNNFLIHLISNVINLNLIFGAGDRRLRAATIQISIEINGATIRKAVLRGKQVGGKVTIW